MGPEAFPELHRQILGDFNPSLGREGWSPLFQWPWPNPEDHVGMMLSKSDGEIVAFASLIYSVQRVRGQAETFCNVSSWVAKEGYGASALALLTPILGRRDITTTNLTSIPAVHTIFRRLGFVTLETHKVVSFPFLGLWPRRYRVRRDADIDDEPLSVDEARVRADHRGCGQHLLVAGRLGSCLILYTLGRRRGLGVARVQHVSAPRVFVDALPALHRHFLLRGVPLIDIDERLLAGHRPAVRARVPLEVPRLFRSAELARHEVSNAYSEMILLDF